MKAWPLYLLLFAIALAMSPRIDVPWIYVDDYASAAFSTIARNHAEFGIGQTRAASILRVDRADPRHSPVYGHHPFLYPLLLAQAFQLLGPHEWVARAAAVSVSLAIMGILYLLMSDAFDRLVGLLAVALYGVSPANLFGGRMVSLEQPALLAIVAAIYFYYRWLRTDARRDFSLCVLVLLLGMLTEWQVYYLAAILPLHHLGMARDRWPQLCIIAVLAPLAFGLFVLHLYAADPQQTDQLWQAFRHRTGVMDDAEQLAFTGHVASYTVGELLATIGHHLVHRLSWPLLLLAGGGLIITLRELRSTRALRAWLPLLLLAPAVMHTVLFSNAMYIHQCLAMLFLPGIAAAASIALAVLCRPPVTAPRALLGVALCTWMLSTSMRRTSDFYAHESWDPVLVGNALRETDSASATTLVLGLPYHPAVEWCAQRDVVFVDDMGRNRPRPIDSIALVDGATGFVARGPSADPATEHFRQATAAWLHVLPEYVLLQRVQNRLNYYRAQP